MTAGGPVRNATVTVTAADGTVLGKTTTDLDGRFTTAVTRAEGLRVHATDGTVDGQPQPFALEAVVNPGDPESTKDFNQLDVGVVSTLVAKQMDRSGSDEEMAEGHVNEALGASADDDLEWTTGTQPKTFSLTTLHSEASDGDFDEHDLDALADRVAAQLPATDSPAPVTPASAQVRPAALTTTGTPSGGLTKAFTVADDDVPGGDFAVDVVQDFLKGQAVNLITKWFGLPTGDAGVSSQLAALRAQLDQIQASLEQLDADTKQLAAEQSFDAAVLATNNLRGAIKYSLRIYLEPLADRALDLRQATATRAALPADATPASVQAADQAVAAAQAAYDNALTNFKTNYQSSQEEGGYEQLNMYLVPGPGNQSKTLVQRYADIVRSRRFISSADSDELFTVYDYFASYEAVSAHLEVEFQSAISGAVQQSVDDYEKDLTAQESYLPTHLTTPGVVVDVVNNTMWAGQPSPGVVHFAMTGMQGVPGPPGDGRPGWNVASTGQLQQLISGRGKSSVPAYMAAISTPTGFQKGPWSTLSQPLLSSTPATQHVIIMDGQWNPSALDTPVAPALTTSGSFTYAPNISKNRMMIYPDLESMYPASGQVVFARTLPAGEAYL